MEKNNAIAKRAIVIAVLNGIIAGKISAMSAVDFAVAESTEKKALNYADSFKAYKESVSALQDKVCAEKSATASEILVANWITDFAGITVSPDDLGVDIATASARRYVAGGTTLTASGRNAFRASLEKAIFNVLVGYNYADNGLSAFYTTRNKKIKAENYVAKLKSALAVAEKLTASDDAKIRAEAVVDRNTLKTRLVSAEDSFTTAETAFKSATKDVSTRAAENTADMIVRVQARLNKGDSISAIANGIIANANKTAKAVGKAVKTVA